MQGYTYQPKSIDTSNSINIAGTTTTTSTKEKYFIWHIQGGLGKNIAGTALVKTIKQTYPDRKLIMVTSWPEVYLNNPDVDRVYQIVSGSNGPAVTTKSHDNRHQGSRLQ